MPEFSTIPVKDLLAEALTRPNEMIDERGFLSREAFRLMDLLGIRVCVDGAALRETEEGVELMAINRNSGPYKGTCTLVGGGVGRVGESGVWEPESIEEALRRHFNTDLGFEIEPLVSWDQPQLIAQDMRPVNGEVKDGFMPNPDSRHLVAARYLVRITNYDDAPVFGSTEVGGQEASGVNWFSRANLPSYNQFGYNHRVTYKAMFDIADSLLQPKA